MQQPGHTRPSLARPSPKWARKVPAAARQQACHRHRRLWHQPLLYNPPDEPPPRPGRPAQTQMGPKGPDLGREGAAGRTPATSLPHTGYHATSSQAAAPPPPWPPEEHRTEAGRATPPRAAACRATSLHAREETGHRRRRRHRTGRARRPDPTAAGTKGRNGGLRGGGVGFPCSPTQGRDRGEGGGGRKAAAPAGGGAAAARSRAWWVIRLKRIYNF